MSGVTVTTDLNAREVTPHLARLVLGRFGSGDDRSLWIVHPSDGEDAMLTAATSVDGRLLSSLAAGFPGLVAAVQMAYRRGGVDELMAIARGES